MNLGKLSRIFFFFFLIKQRITQRLEFINSNGWSPFKVILLHFVSSPHHYHFPLLFIRFYFCLDISLINCNVSKYEFLFIYLAWVSLGLLKLLVFLTVLENTQLLSFQILYLFHAFSLLLYCG